MVTAVRQLRLLQALDSENFHGTQTTRRLQWLHLGSPAFYARATCIILCCSGVCLRVKFLKFIRRVLAGRC